MKPGLKRAEMAFQNFSNCPLLGLDTAAAWGKGCAVGSTLHEAVIAALFSSSAASYHSSLQILAFCYLNKVRS